MVDGTSSHVFVHFLRCGDLVIDAISCQVLYSFICMPYIVFMIRDVLIEIMLASTRYYSTTLRLVFVVDLFRQDVKADTSVAIAYLGRPIMSINLYKLSNIHQLFKALIIVSPFVVLL